VSVLSLMLLDFASDHTRPLLFKLPFDLESHSKN
jgi:hypothetical protein